MSDETAVLVEGLSKAYQLGQFSAKTLKASVRRWLGREEGREADLFWALKDVSFKVKRGEAFGIIGHNGAGKSTLLKLLSRITEPTRGQATLCGRVASLLEVGTGFHPELTGRENIYLNGTVLGLKRRDIKAQFDSIIDFAEVGAFIDTPVKRYSSGMYVRLAFAVAAHLNPEILIVDEVLAVGDASFQKKCLGKMEDVTHQGRTVLFVSHNMNAVKMLTKRCLLLNKGKTLCVGDSPTIVEQYLGSSGMLRGGSVEVSDEDRKRSNKETARELLVRRVSLSNPATGEIKDSFVEHEPFQLTIDMEAAVGVRAVEVIAQLVRDDGVLVCSLMTEHSDKEYVAGTYRLSCRLDRTEFARGNYRFSLYVLSGTRRAQDYIPDAISFCIGLSVEGQYGTRDVSGELRDIVRPHREWSDMEPCSAAGTGSIA